MKDEYKLEKEKRKKNIYKVVFWCSTILMLIVVFLIIKNVKESDISTLEGLPFAIILVLICWGFMYYSRKKLNKQKKDQYKISLNSIKKSFIPSKAQWSSWKLQNKLTLISTYIVIVSTFISFLIYSGNFYKKNSRITEIKTILVKNKWAFNNLPSFAKYKDKIKPSELKEIESEFGMDFNLILLYMGSMMSNGLMTYEFFSDGTYKFNFVGDVKAKKEKYEISKENNKYFLVLKPENIDRKEKFIISEISDDKLILIQKNEKFNIDMEFEYKPIEN